jgi:hypothetical protein
MFMLRARDNAAQVTGIRRAQTVIGRTSGYMIETTSHVGAHARLEASS